MLGYLVVGLKGRFGGDRLEWRILPLAATNIEY